MIPAGQQFGRIVKEGRKGELGEEMMEETKIGKGKGAELSKQWGEKNYEEKLHLNDIGTQEGKQPLG
jgi:hypothetical protein